MCNLLPCLCTTFAIMKNVTNQITKCISLVAFITLSLVRSDAQSFEIGLRYMPTFSTFEITTPGSGRIVGDFKTGYGVGGFIGINVSQHFGFQGEVIYSSINQKYSEQSVERNVNLKYINIPLLLSLNTGKSSTVNFNIVAGPQIGLSVGSDVFTSNGDGTTTTKPVLRVKKGDFGFAYGAGLDFGILSALRLGVGFRGVYGLVDISDNSGTIVSDSYYVLDRTHIKTYSGYIGLSLLL